MRVLRYVGLLALSAVVLAVPASPSVVLATQQVYFKCGTSRLANADGYEGRSIGWSTQAPTTSATQGGGCAAIDARGDQQLGKDEVAGVPVNADFAGTFTGNFDSLTVRAWNAGPADYRAPALLFDGFSVQVTLTVDGVKILDDKEVVLEPADDPTSPATLMEFTVTGLGLLEEEDAGQHTVGLTLDTLQQREPSLWVYDATEVASGVIFNPVSTAAKVVDVGTE